MLRPANTKPDPRQGFNLDVWCNHSEEIYVLRTEICAYDKHERKPTALLLYDLGRTLLASGNEPDAAQALLQSYTYRPQFRPNLRLAYALYRERRDFRLAAKLLDAEARATREPLNRVALLRAQARLLWSQLGQTNEALEILDQAFKLDSTDLATLKLQELIFATTLDQAGLLTTLEQQLEYLSDSQVHSALLIQKALLLTQQGEISAALKTLHTARDAESENFSVLCFLEQIYEKEGMQQKLAETLIRQAEDSQAGESWRARQLARAARIFRDQLKDPAGAIGLFQQSLALEQSLIVAFDCFELLQKQNKPQTALEVGRQLFEIVEDSATRAGLACQIADSYRLELNDQQKAAEWYQNCLKWSPSYQPALESLGTILEEQGAIDQLVEIHRRDLTNIEQSLLRARKLFRIATLLERNQKDEEAIAALQEALAAWPGFQPASSALERIYSRLGLFNDLLELYDIELKQNPDRERLHYILETMATIWHHQIGNLDQAIACYQRLFELDPNHIPTLRICATLLAMNRRWQELVELNDQEIILIGDPRRKVELLHRTGEIWEDQLLNLDQAQTFYQRALEIEPRYLPSLRALGRIYRQRGLWENLIDMHRTELLATDDPEKIMRLQFDIAEVYEEELLDEKKAAESYWEILQRKPADLPAISALTRILRQRLDAKSLVDLFNSSLEALSDNRSKALQLWQIGSLRQQLADVAKAANDFGRALRLCPSLAPARGALEQILEETGDYGQLAELYASAIEQTEIPTEKATLLHRLAEILEHALGNPRKAALLYERAAQLNPTAWCFWSLVKIYDQLDMPRELCRVLEQLAQAIKDEGTSAELNLRIAQIFQAAALGDPTPFFTRALDAGVGKRFTQRALERLLRQNGQPFELEDFLTKQIELTSDPLELSCLLTEKAEIHLKQEDFAGAENAFRLALEHSKSHLPALWGLGQILEQQERWPERAELAEKEASAMESTAGLAEALFRAAMIWENRVGDMLRAIPLYRRVQKIQPGHLESYRRLHAILSAQNDYPGLAALIRTQISITADPLLSSEMFLGLGRLYFEKLRQPRKGEACLRRALDLNPHDIQTLRMLGDIYYRAKKWRLAQKIYTTLEPLLDDIVERAEATLRLGDILLVQNNPTAALAAYKRAEIANLGYRPELLRKIISAAEAAHNTAAQVEALERLSECANDDQERLTVRKQIAQLAESQMENDELAIRTLEEVLILNPLDIESIERLASIFGRISNRSAASQHLQAAVAHHRVELMKRPLEIPLYRNLARIFQWQRQFDRFYCACVVLAHCGELEEIQQRFIHTHQNRCGKIPRGILSQSQYENLLLPQAARNPIREILATAGLGLQKLTAISPLSLGLDKDCRLEDMHPAQIACQEIAALVGILELEVWVSQTQPELIATEMLNKPSIIIGSRVAEKAISPAERFRLGKAIFLIAENALVLRDLSVKKIEQLFKALGMAALPPFALPLRIHSEARIEEVGRRLAKLIPKRDRKLLGSLLPQVADTFEHINLADFARALNFGSNRFGLLAAGNPQVGLAEAALLPGHALNGPELVDLMQYLVSEEYFTLRMGLHLAPEG